jgi:hypothetical protein
MRHQFPGLAIADFEAAKQKHGSDVGAIVQALSAEQDGWMNVKDSKKKDGEVDKSKVLKVREVAATAAGGQPRPEGISRAPNNGAGRGAPRPPRPADASPRENTRTPRTDAPRADAPARTPREVEARPVTAPEARPPVRTPRQAAESPKAAAAAAAAAASTAPVLIKPAAAPVNKWGSGPTFAQREKDKLVAQQQQAAEEAKLEAARKAEELSKQQSANALAKQPQREVRAA